MQKDMGAVRSLGHVSHLRFGTPTVPEDKKTGLYLNVSVYSRPVLKPKGNRISCKADKIFKGKSVLGFDTQTPYRKSFGKPRKFIEGLA